MSWTETLLLNGYIFVIRVRRVGGGYSGEVLDVPGIEAQERSFAKTWEKLREQLVTWCQ